MTLDFKDDPIFTQDGFWPEFWFHTAWSALPAVPSALRWVGTLQLPENGNYRFRLSHNGEMRMYLDGEEVLESISTDSDDHMISEVTRSLKGGSKIKLELEYIRPPQREVIYYKLGMGIDFTAGSDARFERAVKLAKDADKVVFFGGMPEAFEAEGGDRLDMDLPGGQDELIRAIAEVNPNTVVVLNVGAPVNMPWVELVAGIVEAYYPGMENGNAVIRVLLGEVNPSGKLPVTFPKRLQDSPAFINASYPGCREVNYGEGIFVGYRYFEKVEINPLFPFGHGLSYTEFKYSKLTIQKRSKRGNILEISMDVTNIGDRDGAEVVQLYVRDIASSLVRPIKELKGFEKVFLNSGETKTITFLLDDRALAYYDPYYMKWITEPGEFEIHLGSSSKDIRLRGKFELTE